MRRVRYIAPLLLLALLGAGWLFAAGPASTGEEISSAATSPQGAGILDGMTFVGVIGLEDEPADVEDTFVFERGLFLSDECEKRCGYPARPYYVRREGDKIAFVSETRCPDKNAKLVWRGTVEDERIEGEFTWTTVRWYWTIEKTFWFEGTLKDSAVPLATN